MNHLYFEQVSQIAWEGTEIKRDLKMLSWYYENDSSSVKFVFPLSSFELQIKYLQFTRRSINKWPSWGFQLTFFLIPRLDLSSPSRKWFMDSHHRNCHVCRDHSKLLDSLCMMFIVIAEDASWLDFILDDIQMENSESTTFGCCHCE